MDEADHEKMPHDTDHEGERHDRGERAHED
jgi:hypothetical protein